MLSIQPIPTAQIPLQLSEIQDTFGAKRPFLAVLGELAVAQPPTLSGKSDVAAGKPLPDAAEVAALDLAETVAPVEAPPNAPEATAANGVLAVAPILVPELRALPAAVATPHPVASPAPGQAVPTPPSPARRGRPADPARAEAPIAMPRGDAGRGPPPQVLLALLPALSATPAAPVSARIELAEPLGPAAQPVQAIPPTRPPQPTKAKPARWDQGEVAREPRQDLQFDTKLPRHNSVIKSDFVSSPPALPPGSDATVAPALAPPAVSLAAATPTRPHDFATLVDRLVEARESSGVRPVAMALAHPEFGPVELHFHQGSELTVTASSADPGFAGAAIAAAAPAPEGGDRRDDPRFGQAAAGGFGTPSDQAQRNAASPERRASPEAAPFDHKPSPPAAAAAQRRGRGILV